MKNESKKPAENINNSNDKLLLSDVIKSVCYSFTNKSNCNETFNTNEI